MDGDYLIIGIVAVAVILFLLWALLQVNKAKRSKKGPKVDASDVVSIPDEGNSYKKPKTVIKKRNLEKDFNRNTSESKAKKEESEKTGSGKIEQVFTEPMKKEEPVTPPQPEYKVNKKPAYDDKDDFERELDELIAELERETANKNVTAPVAKKPARQPLDDDFDISKLGLFDENEPLYDDRVEQVVNNTKPVEQISAKDMLEDESYFDFTDIDESESKITAEEPISNINIVEGDYQYSRPKVDDSVPNFDKTSFDERREKFLERKTKSGSNVVVLNNTKDSRQKAKNSRNKWL